MDFEQQLEKAEKLLKPSLVGSSLRSADDSPHNNYIHPEKSKTKSAKRKAKSLRNDISASLDDLISEGALLNSEDDFERFLDDLGNIKDAARYTKELKSGKLGLSESNSSEIAESDLKAASSLSNALSEGVSQDEIASAGFGSVADNSTKVTEKELSEAGYHGKENVDLDASGEISTGFSSSIGASNDLANKLRSNSNDIYSAPNLSEYQLENQIESTDDLINSVKSNDPSRLPKTSSYKIQPTKINKKNLRIHDLDNPNFKIDNQQINSPFVDSGLHTPYFHTDHYERSGIYTPDRGAGRSQISERDRSRSKSRSRSRVERSARSLKPHLARGDSYKNIHVEEPSKYELPPDFTVDEEDQVEDERQSRYSKPTMSEKIETLEKQQVGHDDVLTREPSLVTTGDYSNFNVDLPQQNQFNDASKLYAQRSVSSTQYLRTISRSRSRQTRHDADEKNDSNPSELVKEGAFVSDDPYSTIDNLDTMYEEVLHIDGSKPLKGKSKQSDDSKSKTVNKNVKKLNKSEGQEAVKAEVKATEDTLKTIDTIVEAIESAPNPDSTKASKSNEKDLSIKLDDGDKSDVSVLVDNVASVKEVGEKKFEATSEEKKDEVTETEASISKKVLEDEPIEEASKPDTTTKLSSEVSSKIEDESQNLKDKKSKDSTDFKELVIGSEVKEIKFVEEEESEFTDLATNPSKLNEKVVVADKSFDSTTSTETESKATTNLESSKESGDSSGDLLDQLLEELTIESGVNDEKAEEKVDESINDEESESSGPKIDTKPEKLNAKEKTEEKKPIDLSVKKEDIASGAIEKADASEDPESTTLGISSVGTTILNKVKEVVVTDNDEESELKAEKTASSIKTKAGTKKNEISTENTKTSEESTSVVLGIASAGVAIIDQIKDVIIPEENANVTESKEEVSKKLDVEEIQKESKIVDVKKSPEESKNIDESTDNAEATSEKEADNVDKSISLSIVSAGSAILEKIKHATTPEEETKTEGKASETVKKEEAKSIDEDEDDFDVSPEELRKHLESQPIYIYTSLAGGMQIMQKTNRLTTILTANGIKFEYKDLGTDEEAKKIWRRYANGKTLPGVVRGDDFIGNWKEIDDANEEYKLQELLYETL